MRKIIIMFVAMFCVCNFAIAGNGIKVTQGDKKIFKNIEGTALLDIKFDGAQYDKRMPLTEKFDNLDELKVVALDGFIEEFNDNCKNVNIDQKASDAKYKITMVVTNMDQYFKVMGWVPGNATKVWGTLTVTDIATGSELVVVEVKEVDGGANPVPSGSFSDCFEELGKLVAKLR